MLVIDNLVLVSIKSIFTKNDLIWMYILTASLFLFFFIISSLIPEKQVYMSSSFSVVITCRQERISTVIFSTYLERIYIFSVFFKREFCKSSVSWNNQYSGYPKIDALYKVKYTYGSFEIRGQYIDTYSTKKLWKEWILRIQKVRFDWETIPP